MVPAAGVYAKVPGTPTVAIQLRRAKLHPIDDIGPASATRIAASPCRHRARQLAVAVE
jgi:hypothetical protein